MKKIERDFSLSFAIFGLDGGGHFKLLAKGMSLDHVCEVTDLTVEKIKQLLGEDNDQSPL